MPKMLKPIFMHGGPFDFSDSPRGQIPLSLIGFDWDWDLASGLSIIKTIVDFLTAATIF